jgi:uncharacterized protein with von Willebrand factor type A (vWA) domain
MEVLPDLTEKMPLHGFFDALRRSGFELGMGEYYALLDALHADFRQDETKDCLHEDNLFFLCALLWLKPEQSKSDFRQMFEAHFAPVVLPTVPEKAGKAENTSNLPTQTDEAQDGKTQKNEPPETLPTDEAKPEKDSPTDSPPKNLPAQKTENELLHIKFELLEEAQGQDKTQVPHSAKLFERNFIFNSQYFPLSTRQMSQAFRFLPIFQPSKASEKIDARATALHWAKKGYFEKPIFERQKMLYNQAILLIDNKGSMQAFEALSDSVGEALNSAFGGKARVHYFYNVPQGFVYSDRAHTEHTSLDQLLQMMKQKSTLVLVLSDAGAARGGNHTDRFKASLRFVVRLQAEAKRVVWLNPMPAERWEKTTAERLSKFVEMHTLNDSAGLQKAVRFLRNI